MSYFDKLVNLLRKNIYDYPPFQVVEVRPEDYARYDVIAREDPLICYSNGTSDTNEIYEIVVLKDLQSKSAFRYSFKPFIQNLRQLFGSIDTIFDDIS